ncbi:cell division protein FtsZ [Candidatus Micrarchaeota archaeon CG1_02_47_40]|nr:MAG: cell division protein FtsZ [Candidatus Micrarchaeota archaeon CG1_02_47_40]
MLESFVSSALENNASLQAKQADDISNSDVRIAVIGVGGGGCNTIHRITKAGIKSATTVAINTDQLHLKSIMAQKRVLIGQAVTKGLGAGGFPEVGQKCAEISRDKLAEVIGENELVFLCAGMGGGTGTGAAPVVAQVAKEQGAIVVSIVTYPFNLERIRIKKAQWGLEQLAKVSDTVVVIDNNRLVQYAPNIPINDAFFLADNITARAVRGISDTIMMPSLLNMDYADVKSVMEQGGVSLISVGEGRGTDRVEKVVKSTLDHPLLDVSYEGAKGALIHIAGSASLTLGEAITVGEKISEAFDNNANVKLGARITPEIGEDICVTAIITGLPQTPSIFGKVPQNERERTVVEELAAI